MSNIDFMEDLGVIGILAIVICLGALGFAGWYGYSHHLFSSRKSGIDLSGKSAGVQKAAEGAEFLEVRQLGIKIALADGIRDLTVKPYGSTTAVFSLQSFIDATAQADTIKDKDGASNCLNVVSVVLFSPGQRQQLENDRIQAYKFDADGKPLDGQLLVQLADKRYARFRTYQAPCVASGEGADKLWKREAEVKDVLLNSLPANISSL